MGGNITWGHTCKSLGKATYVYIRINVSAYGVARFRCQGILKHRFGNVLFPLWTYPMFPRVPIAKSQPITEYVIYVNPVSTEGLVAGKTLSYSNILLKFLCFVFRKFQSLCELTLTEPDLVYGVYHLVDKCPAFESTDADLYLSFWHRVCECYIYIYIVYQTSSHQLISCGPFY